MKARLGVVLAVLALLAVAFVPNVARAASDATCWSDPSEAYIGDTVTIYCAGFSPNTVLSGYYVEPAGTAITIGNFLKTDQYGEINGFFGTKDGNFAAISLGDWVVVFEEKGLANSLIHRGEARFRVIGGKEGVSGAKVWSSDDVVTKDEFPLIYGSGFAPFEIVTVWWEYPNGDCSTFTYHDWIFNTPGFRGYSTVIRGDIKADASGNWSYFDGWAYTACEGTYRIVARGNSSGWGGYTWVTVTGNAVSTNAWMTASPDRVAALFDWVYFSGWGFAPNQAISCWLTTPKNQLTVVDQWWQLPVKSDASGAFTFPIYTGNLFPGLPLTSEGALGVYAMTCRDGSGNTAIAQFTVTGGIYDP